LIPFHIGRSQISKPNADLRSSSRFTMSFNIFNIFSDAYGDDDDDDDDDDGMQ
jgi:hypothetical protein